MDFDTGLRTGACALSQLLRVLYTAKVCTTVSVKLLSITRVCAGSIRHGTRTVYKVLTLPVETEYKSGSTPRRTESWTTLLPLLARALTWSRTLSFLPTAPPQLLHRRLRNHIVVYIFVRSFVQPRSGLRNHRVLIATPHQEEQCLLNLQYGLAGRGFCRSNYLCRYIIRQKGTLPIASSPHALLTPTHRTKTHHTATRLYNALQPANTYERCGTECCHKAALSVAGATCMGK
jgi:hypothetical protein